MICICQRIIFIIFAINYIYTLAQIAEKGYCTKNTDVRTTNGTDILEKNYCCRHYERINNECQECNVGYTTKNGQPCQQCEIGLYGRRCAFICQCRDSERCHNIIGCINTQEKFTQKVTDLTVKLKETSTSAQNPKPHNLGLYTREVIIYSICAVVFVIFVILCITCQRWHKQIYSNFRRYRAENRRERTVPHNSLPDIPLHEVEGVYDEINESNMIENIQNVMDSVSSVSETNESYCQPDSNDYLTPYHPADKCSNNSIGNKSESSTNSNDHHQTTSISRDYQSNSISSDRQGSRSSYLNPYQPIVNPAEIKSHEYLSIHKTNECCASKSGDQTKDSGFLNSYQSITQHRNLHEYKSLNTCTDGVGSLMSDASTENKIKVSSSPSSCEV